MLDQLGLQKIRIINSIDILLKYKMAFWTGIPMHKRIWYWRIPEISQKVMLILDAVQELEY